MNSSLPPNKRPRVDEADSPPTGPTENLTRLDASSNPNHQQEKITLYDWFTFFKDEQGKLVAFCKICDHKQKSNLAVVDQHPNLRRHLKEAAEKNDHETSGFAKNHCAALQSIGEAVPGPLKRHMAKSKPMGSEERRSAGFGLVRTVLKAGLPLSTLSSEGTASEEFRKFCMFLRTGKEKDTGEKLWARKTLSGYVSGVYLSVLNALKVLLHDVDGLQIQFDFWTTKNKREKYGTMVGTFVKNSQFHEVRFGLKPLPSTSEELSPSDVICGWVKEVLEYFSLKSSFVIAVVTDGGSDVRKSLEMLNWTECSLICANHQLHNSVLRALQRAQAKLEPFTKIVKKLNQSAKSQVAYRNLQQDLDLEALCLLSPCVTRWNGVFLMLLRFLRRRAAVTKFCGDMGLIPPDFNFAAELVGVLSPVYQVSMNFQTNGMSSVALGVIDLLMIRNSLQPDQQLDIPLVADPEEGFANASDSVIAGQTFKCSFRKIVFQEVANVRDALFEEIQQRFFWTKHCGTSSIKSRANIFENCDVLANIALHPALWSRKKIQKQPRFAWRNSLNESEKSIVTFERCASELLRLRDTKFPIGKVESPASELELEVEDEVEVETESPSMSKGLQRFCEQNVDSDEDDEEEEDGLVLALFSKLMEIRASDDRSLLALKGKQRMEVADENVKAMLKHLSEVDTSLYKSYSLLLGMQMSSAASERDFSIASMESNGRLGSISPESLHERAFVRANADYVPSLGEICATYESLPKKRIKRRDGKPSAAHMATKSNSSRTQDTEPHNAELQETAAQAAAHAAAQAASSGPIGSDDHGNDDDDDTWDLQIDPSELGLLSMTTALVSGKVLFPAEGDSYSSIWPEELQKEASVDDEDEDPFALLESLS